MNFLPADRSTNLAIWAGLAGALAIWQFVALARPDLPTVGSLVVFLKQRRVGRWSLLAGWMWLGWHLWVRGSWM